MTRFAAVFARRPGNLSRRSPARRARDQGRATSRRGRRGGGRRDARRRRRLAGRGGAVGSSSPLPTGFSLEAIDMISTTEAWAVGQVGTILHTTDGGASSAEEASGTQERPRRNSVQRLAPRLGSRYEPRALHARRRRHVDTRDGDRRQPGQRRLPDCDDLLRRLRGFDRLEDDRRRQDVEQRDIPLRRRPLPVLRLAEGDRIGAGRRPDDERRRLEHRRRDRARTAASSSTGRRLEPKRRDGRAHHRRRGGLAGADASVELLDLREHLRRREERLGRRLGGEHRPHLRRRPDLGDAARRSRQRRAPTRSGTSTSSTRCTESSSAARARSTPPRTAARRGRCGRAAAANETLAIDRVGDGSGPSGRTRSSRAPRTAARSGTKKPASQSRTETFRTSTSSTS